MSSKITVECSVNELRRLLNSRYHTAGHLLGNIVEQLYPDVQATKGHSFPGEAYAEFISIQPMDSDKLQQAINDAITLNFRTVIFECDPQTFKAQFYKLPYTVPNNKKFRAKQIAHMMPVACGGTHLKSIEEIGYLSIEEIKAKNNITRISYRLT